MVKVGIKDFRKNLRKYIKSTPVGITHRGDLVAVLVKPELLENLAELAHGRKSPPRNS